MYSYSCRERPSNGLELSFLKSGHTISQTSLQILRCPLSNRAAQGIGWKCFVEAQGVSNYSLLQSQLWERWKEKRERERKRKGGRKPAGGVPPPRHTPQRDAWPLPARSRHKPSLGLNINKEVQQCINALFPVNKNC